MTEFERNAHVEVASQLRRRQIRRSQLLALLTGTLLATLITAGTWLL